jgi:hypothetical protein
MLDNAELLLSEEPTAAESCTERECTPLELEELTLPAPEELLLPEEEPCTLLEEELCLPEEECVSLDSALHAVLEMLAP